MRDDNSAIITLMLFVNGHDNRSRLAIANLEAFIDEHLPDVCSLRVINIHDNPEVLDEYQIVATPTLLKELPMPVVRMVGDLSNHDAIFDGMGIETPQLRSEFKTSGPTIRNI